LLEQCCCRRLSATTWGTMQQTGEHDEQWLRDFQDQQRWEDGSSAEMEMAPPGLLRDTSIPQRHLLPQVVLADDENQPVHRTVSPEKADSSHVPREVPGAGAPHGPEALKSLALHNERQLSTCYSEGYENSEAGASSTVTPLRARKLQDNPVLHMGDNIPENDTLVHAVERTDQNGELASEHKSHSMWHFLSTSTRVWRTRGTGGGDQQRTDWGRKLRIFVGDAGLQADSGGYLRGLDDTAGFRDALLEYANHFWLENNLTPMQAMALQVVDYGDVETKTGDGKVDFKMQKAPLFIPLGNMTAHGLSTGLERPKQSSSSTCCPPLPKWLGCPKRAHDSTALNEGRHSTTYAPITLSGDIQMGVRAAPNIFRSQAQLEAAGEAALSSSSKMREATIFLDVYGDNGIRRVQRLVEDVLQMSSNRRVPREPQQQEQRQLYWYTLAGWGDYAPRGGRARDSAAPALFLPVPLFQKKPIHGDRQYQLDYHLSFFHPKKDNIIGSSHSLLDQFRDGTGNYAVPGVQQKLNLLLFGPPGTGKSKFVRTAAMYLQRHVVSFALSQVATEIQLMTLLDDLKTITDAPERREDYTYKDLLFVVEEIDADPRGICLQRTQPDGPMPCLPTAPEEGEERDKEREEKDKEKPKKSASPPLSLGLLLRTLDGGSETPGRAIIMTTNREELLDEAFKRPGRMKKLRLDNLKFQEFKLMILHFRRFQGKVPTIHMWTRAIDQMAKRIMEDYEQLQDKRSGDLDRRGLGLSPALLEELCIGSHSLEELFGMLVIELGVQWPKTDLPGRPASAELVDMFDWRMHAVRQTVLFHLKDSVKHSAAKAEWPEVRTSRIGDAEKEVQSEQPRENDVVYLLRCMLKDEARYNEALELCPQDYGYQHPDLKYRLQLELAPGLSAMKKNAGIGSALGEMMQELKHKWRLAWRTEDDDLRGLLESNWPMSSAEAHRLLHPGENSLSIRLQSYNPRSEPDEFDPHTSWGEPSVPVERTVQGVNTW